MKTQLEEALSAETQRNGELTVELENASAHATERESQLAAAEVEETELRAQLAAVTAEAREAEEARRVDGEMKDAHNARTQSALEETQAEAESLEQQLGTAELRAAASTLYTSLHNSWLVTMAEV